MRRLRLLVVVLLAGLALAACGDSASPEEVVVGSVDETMTAGTARIEQRIDTDGGAADTTVTAKGVTDLDEMRTSLTMELQGQDIDVVVDDGTMYQRIPGFEEQFGTPWVKVDLDAVGDTIGFDLGGLSQSGSSDPAEATAFLRGAGTVEEVGKAKVRGEDTTHYHAVVDYERAAAAASSKAQAKLLRQSADTLGVDRQPVDVWIDGDGRVRKLEQEIDMAKADRPEGVDASQMPDTMSITVELYDFGAEVDIDVPDEDDVTDISHLLGQQPGQGSGTASSETDALESLLLGQVPEGFEAQPDDVGDTGPSDLEKAIRDDGSDDARQLLAEEGFVAGYQRLWLDEDDSELIAFLYQFETPDGAAANADRQAESFSEEPDEGTLERFTVEGIPGSRGWHFRHEEGDVAIVLFTRDAYVVQLVLNGQATDRATLEGLARQQYDLLVSDGA